MGKRACRRPWGPPGPFSSILCVFVRFVRKRMIFVKSMCNRAYRRVKRALGGPFYPSCRDFTCVFCLSCEKDVVFVFFNGHYTQGNKAIGNKDTGKISLLGLFGAQKAYVTLLMTLLEGKICKITW